MPNEVVNVLANEEVWVAAIGLVSLIFGSMKSVGGERFVIAKTIGRAVLNATKRSPTPVLAALALAISSAPAMADGTCNTEQHVEAKFLGTGFVAYDYTAAIPVLGMVQINIGLECKNERWIWDPVNVDATDTIRRGALWIGSKIGG